MMRTKLLPEIRKMRFGEAYDDCSCRRIDQTEALGECFAVKKSDHMIFCILFSL